MKLKCIIHSKAGMKGSVIERNGEIARKLIEKKICVEYVAEVKAKVEPKAKAKTTETKTETKKETETK